MWKTTVYFIRTMDTIRQTELSRLVRSFHGLFVSSLFSFLRHIFLVSFLSFFFFEKNF